MRLFWVSTVVSFEYPPLAENHPCSYESYAVMSYKAFRLSCLCSLDVAANESEKGDIVFFETTHDENALLKLQGCAQRGVKLVAVQHGNPMQFQAQLARCRGLSGVLLYDPFLTEWNEILTLPQLALPHPIYPEFLQFPDTKPREDTALLAHRADPYDETRCFLASLLLARKADCKRIKCIANYPDRVREVAQEFGFDFEFEISSFLPLREYLDWISDCALVIGWSPLRHYGRDAALMAVNRGPALMSHYVASKLCYGLDVDFDGLCELAAAWRERDWVIEPEHLFENEEKIAAFASFIEEVSKFEPGQS